MNLVAGEGPPRYIFRSVPQTHPETHLVPLSPPSVPGPSRGQCYIDMLSRGTWTSFGLCLLLLFLSTITAAAAHDSSMSVAEALAAFPGCAVCYYVPAQHETLKCDLTHRNNQRPCIDSSMAHSGCISTDVTCLCNDRVLTDTASSCVRSTCTVKETLSTGPILLSSASYVKNGLLTLANSVSKHLFPCVRPAR